MIISTSLHKKTTTILQDGRMETGNQLYFDLNKTIMSKILLFGAGKSATVLIDYLLHNAGKENWQLVVVDANLELAKSKIGDSYFAEATSFDIHNARERQSQVQTSDIVISL